MKETYNTISVNPVSRFVGAEINNVDVVSELRRLGLNEHLSSQRSNGLRAMVTRVTETAAVA